MLRHLEIRSVDVWLVSVRTLHCAPKLIGYDHFRHAAEEFKASNRRAHEIRKRLRSRRFCVGIVARAEHHHKQVDLVHLTRLRICQPRFLAGIVDKCLLAGAVHAAHRWLQAHPPRAVELAELAVLIWLAAVAARRDAFLILGPQQLKRHTCSMKLAVHVCVVDRRACRREVAPAVVKQRGIDFGVGHQLHALPRQPHFFGPLEVAADRAHRHAQRACNLALATAAVFQSK